MKVWLDLESIEMLSTGYRADGECDSECGEKDVRVTEYKPYHAIDELLCRMTAMAEQEDLDHRLLQQPTSLYMQNCGPERWLVCNPARSGLVAVLDDEGRKLLERFRTATTLAAVSATMPHATTLARSVHLLVAAGFLQPVAAQPSPSPAAVDEQIETLTAWLHVTNSCNLACDYCYVAKTSEHMSEETARRALEAIFRSARRHGCRAVLLKYAGGEATLRLRLVLALHDYALELAKQANIDLSAYILTNGVALSRRAIEELKMRGIGLMLSLDGVGEEHDRQRPFLNGKGSFTLVDRSIQRLLAAGLVPHINVTVSRRNLGGLPALMEYLLEHDLPFTLSYYRDHEGAASRQELLFAEAEMIAAMRAAFAVIEHRLPRRRLLGSLIDRTHPGRPHRYTCGMGRNYLVIDQRGGVARCHGAIEETVTSIEAADPLEAVRRRDAGLHAVPVEEKEGCRSCFWRYWCSGGCPLLTYRLTGRLDVKSPNCNIYKALFPEALRLEALRLLKYRQPLIT
jgi:uncharacterized protein